MSRWKIALLDATPWAGFAGNPQHTAQASVASQPLEAIHWSTPIDTNPPYQPNGSLLVHYGSPIITAANTVIMPRRHAVSGGYDLLAIDGPSGAIKWTETEGREFLAPSASWIPEYGPTLAQLPDGPRVYWPGAGGTVFYRDSPDSAGEVTAGRIAFYGTGNYLSDPAGFSGVRIASPITADSQGNIYFTYRTTGTNPLGLQAGIARIAADGTPTFSPIGHPALNNAPALSNDESVLYVVIGGALGRYDSTTLSLINFTSLGTVNDSSTASPTIGPDGDVYLGVLSPSVHYRGSLSHFSADLTQSFTPGSFGWDTTVSIVPASMVGGYSGPSEYLVMTKYNDYANSFAGGTGENKIAILDPNVTDPTDPVTGQPAMDTVISIAGLTPDEEFIDEHPGAVREWCINTGVVDPFTQSVLANNEDGILYRWDTLTNSFSEMIQLTDGIGQAYTPTVVGVDGTVYVLQDATLFAVGAKPKATIADLAQIEGTGASSAFVFTVSLSAANILPVTVAYSFQSGSADFGEDFLAATATLTFAPGVTALPITVAVVADAEFEPDEEFFVNLTAVDEVAIEDSQGTGTILNDDARVVNRQLFYNNSAWDGNTLGVSTSDVLALATDKVAYKPGDGAMVNPGNASTPNSFKHVTSYSRGINGVFIDIQGPHAASLTAADFEFRINTGTNNSPSTWDLAASPATITILPNTPAIGTDRIEIIWPNNSIRNNWLAVYVKANGNTGLADNPGGKYGAGNGDLFFFGNRIGDAWITDNGSFSTGINDESATHVSGTGTAAITNRFDFDRNKSVGVNDESIAHLSGGVLNYINIGIPPLAPPPAPGGGGESGDAGISSALASVGGVTDLGAPRSAPASLGLATDEDAATAGRTSVDVIDRLAALWEETCSRPVTKAADEASNARTAQLDELIDELCHDALL